MNVAIITTGDEIMAGNVVDTNAAWLSDHCWKLGPKVVWRFAVRDDLGEIGEACRLASKKADVVFVSGGLGPTVDDITLEAAAKAFGKKMEFHPAIYQEIERFFKRVGRPLAASNRKQAYLPESGEPIPNKVGTAPGCQVKLGGADFFFLPGVPAELYPMAEDFILPWLREKLAGKLFYRDRILHCFGAPEASLDTMLQGVELGDVRLSFRVRFPEILLKLACWGDNVTVMDQKLNEVVKNVSVRVGEYIYGDGETSLPAKVGELLRQKKMTIAVAESCTGGLITNWITDVPGSSDYFERGIIAYSNRSKVEILGVAESLIQRHGAVSSEVAKAMSEGMRKMSRAALGLSVTGIAGPTGGTKEKPVGTVYIGLATPKVTEVRHYCFARDRLSFKQIVAATALDWVRRYLFAL